MYQLHSMESCPKVTCCIVWKSLIKNLQNYFKSCSPHVRLFNRPSVAGAVLETPPLLIKLVCRSVILFPPDLQNIITPKP